MPNILIKFKNQPRLNLKINNDVVGQQYFNLVKDNYQCSMPIFRENLKYTTEYMHQLAIQAKEVLGWDWYSECYSIENTTLLHKNIEQLVGKGFDTIPAECDNLIHELHYCLHIVQIGKTLTQRRGWMQIEWYNDSGFKLDKKYQFNRGLKFGDIKLQNPWVGHGPLQIFLEQDFANISQTCKFHNFVKPGINIVIQKFEDFTEVDELLEKFQKHDPAFVNLHGVEKIKHYIGYPVVGTVVNIDDLKRVVAEPLLELESIDFDET
jgi:hypothetical protein